MGKTHTAQVRKMYLLGVHNDTNVSVGMHTMDLAFITAFYTLKSVKRKNYAVQLSARGFVCGLSLDALVDGNKKSYHYQAKSAHVLEESHLALKRGESIRKLTVGYTDSAIVGLELFTETQRVRIGDCDHAEYRAEADYLEANAAIIGFDACFGEDRLVELSLFIAPLQKVEGIEKMTKPYLNASSFALVDEDFYQMMKQQQKDQVVIKSAFKETKIRKMKSA